MSARGRAPFSSQRALGAILLLACGLSGCFMTGYETYLRDAAVELTPDGDPKRIEPNTNAPGPEDASSNDDANEPTDAADAAVAKPDASSDAGEAPPTALDGGNSARDDGGLDAQVNENRDAGPVEAGPMDAGAMDAGPLDASDASDAAIAPPGCVGQATCTPAQCPAGQSCDVNCADAGTCNAVCPAGATCNVLCESATSCNVTCQAGARCRVRCRDDDSCGVSCERNASCNIFCSSAGSCDFALCLSGPMSCRMQSTCGGAMCE